MKKIPIGRLCFAPWSYAISFTFFICMLYVLMEALLHEHLDYFCPLIGYGGTFAFSSVRLGPIDVSLYWVMHGVGLAGMLVLCVHRKQKFHVSYPVAIFTAFILAVFGYIGAKILYIFENLDKFRDIGFQIGGVSFFGTVFFMPLVLPIFARLFGLSAGAYMDYCTPSGLIMLTSIRLGCFFNGCCHGITLWVMNRPMTLPSQLLECTLDMLLLALLFQAEGYARFSGRLYALFMGGYGVIRFLTELTRDSPKTPLSNGQWFSLVCIGICIAIFWLPKAVSYRKQSK